MKFMTLPLLFLHICREIRQKGSNLGTIKYPTYLLTLTCQNCPRNVHFNVTFRVLYYLSSGHADVMLFMYGSKHNNNRYICITSVLNLVVLPFKSDKITLCPAISHVLARNIDAGVAVACGASPTP